MSAVFAICALICGLCAIPWTVHTAYIGLRYGRVPNYIPLWQPLGVVLFTFLTVMTS